MRQTLEMGGSVIRLTDCGFERSFQAQGQRFRDMFRRALAAHGSLAAKRRPQIPRQGYKEFNTMNDLAAAIALHAA